MLITFYNECELWKLCTSVCGDRWAPDCFDLSNMYSISSLTTREPPTKVSAQRQGCTMGNEPERMCASLPLLWDQHGIRRIGLTVVKSPGITYHYLFLPQRKPKTCSNCIINIIAVWGPIILWASPAPTLNHALLIYLSTDWLCEQSFSGLSDQSFVGTAWRHSQHTTL